MQEGNLFFHRTDPSFREYGGGQFKKHHEGPQICHLCNNFFFFFLENPIIGMAFVNFSAFGQNNFG